MRQIVLDTETTGLEPSQGHRIIEIGCVELVNRKLTGNHYHQYIKPERDIDEGAIEVHGITSEFLADKPVFSQIIDDFIKFVDGAELVIHNAPFDVGFLNHEFRLHSSKAKTLESYCKILDTLAMARRIHPGQKNNLDALCKRYMVDNSQRELHGALLDAEILADVYLLMTGGQTRLALGGKQGSAGEYADEAEDIRRADPNRPKLKVIQASEEELLLHRAKLDTIDKISGGNCLWKQQGEAGEH